MGYKAKETYQYKDAQGRAVYEAVRLRDGYPKRFLMRRGDPQNPGHLIHSIQGVRRVLYRLPELLAADVKLPVFLVIGERHADRLAQAGLVATTYCQGVHGWREDYVDFFRGREVVLLPKNNVDGYEHSRGIVNSLLAVTPSVKILDLPGLAHGGDVSDWINAGGKKKDLLALAKATPECETQLFDLRQRSARVESRPMSVEELEDRIKNQGAAGTTPFKQPNQGRKTNER